MATKSETAKDKHKRAHKRTESSKDRRRAEQAEREAANRKRRAAGQPTPWEAAEAARAKKRADRPAQHRIPGSGNILLPDGSVKACCSARTAMTRAGRVKCPHHVVSDNDRVYPLRLFQDLRGI